MLLGLIDAFVFPISRMIESLLDEVEYWSAKNASLRTAKQRARNSKNYSDGTAHGPYDSQRASAAPLSDKPASSQVE